VRSPRHMPARNAVRGGTPLRLACGVAKNQRTRQENIQCAWGERAAAAAEDARRARSQAAAVPVHRQRASCADVSHLGERRIFAAGVDDKNRVGEDGEMHAEPGP
jgi:hypothetical protein